MKKGACRNHDPNKWFPLIVDEDGDEWFDDGTIWQAYGDTSQFYEEGRTICATCPVRASCLKYSFDERQFWGMWGGLTPIERRRIERGERRKRLKDKRRNDSDTNTDGGTDPSDGGSFDYPPSDD